MFWKKCTILSRMEDTRTIIKIMLLDRKKFVTPTLMVPSIRRTPRYLTIPYWTAALNLGTPCDSSITTIPEAFAAAVAVTSSPSEASTITCTPDKFATIVAATIVKISTPNHQPTTNHLRRDLPRHLLGGTWSYYWSHGYRTNLRHSSLTCRHKKHGHKDKATLTN